ncbi:MAG: transglycosylase SLT domain-containing protein [Planctomycetota bacterium]|nr:transglycosylase SLT domain-containing protein [Planctomycetota bacterium]
MKKYFWWKIVILSVLWLIALYFASNADGKEDLKWDTTSPYIHALTSNLSVWEQFRMIREDRIRAIVMSKSEEFDIDPKILLTLAKCESNFDPKAKNPNSSASGLFQFVKKTWDWTIKEMGQPTWDVFNPEHNTAAAAFLIKKDGLRHWEQCWKFK